MNFVFTCESLKRGGTERQVLILASSLMQTGHKVSILINSDKNQEYHNEYPAFKNHIFPLRGKRKFEKFNSLRNHLKKIKPEVVVSFDFFTSFCCLMLYRFNGFVFINGSIRHGVRLIKISHWVRSFICWLSPYVMANSIAGLKANNLYPGKKRFVLYNGIEEKFRIKPGNAIKLKQLKNLFPTYSTNSIVLISIANLNPMKDYFTVLESLKEISDKIDFFYIIIGEGPLRNKIENTIKKNNISDRVKLLGKIENVDEYLACGDIFIHSSKGEGLSNAILEAMFAGLPVVATDVGGVKETVFLGSSVLFPYKDIKSLTFCLIEAVNTLIHFDRNSIDYKNHLSKFSVEKMRESFLAQIIKIRNK